jgi:hypothetical protein
MLTYFKTQNNNTKRQNKYSMNMTYYNTFVNMGLILCTSLLANFKQCLFNNAQNQAFGN